MRQSQTQTDSQSTPYTPTAMRPFWIEQALFNDGDLAPALHGDIKTDICIVGGGYTGLWTAIQTKRAAAPDGRVAGVQRAIGDDRNRAAHRIDAEFRHDGTLYTATNPAQIGTLDPVMQALESCGIESYYRLSPAEMARCSGAACR